MSYHAFNILKKPCGLIFAAFCAKILQVASRKKGKRETLFYKDRLFTASVIIFLLLSLTVGVSIWLLNQIQL